MSTRLTTELRLLYTVERDFKLPAAPVIRQLAIWEDAPLPDVLLPVPAWLTFTWPVSGTVSYEDYWRARDGGRESMWMGPYL